MNGLQSLISANEFSLAIALTVFVIITVVLATLLILLGASKNFRAVFFHEHKKKKSTKPKAEKLSDPAVAPIEQSTEVESAKPRRANAGRRPAGEPEYLNAIPTIPLNGLPADNPPAKARTPRKTTRMSDGVQTIEIPAASTAQEQGGVYTPRSITITRARTASRTPAASAEQGASDEQPKSTTRRRR